MPPRASSDRDVRLVEREAAEREDLAGGLCGLWLMYGTGRDVRAAMVADAHAGGMDLSASEVTSGRLPRQGRTSTEATLWDGLRPCPPRLSGAGGIPLLAAPAPRPRCPWSRRFPSGPAYETGFPSFTTPTLATTDGRSRAVHADRAVGRAMSVAIRRNRPTRGPNYLCGSLRHRLERAVADETVETRPKPRWAHVAGDPSP